MGRDFNVGRLSDEFGQYLLYLKCSECAHERQTYPNLLAHLCGWDATLQAVEKRLRCSKCGKKRCHIRAVPLQKPRGIPQMCIRDSNKYLYAEKLPVIFQLGRVVMPMFGFVLAYNLARPDALARGVHGRMMYRLTLMGLAASPMCIILNGMFVTASAWWPLNILFMLLLVVSLTYLIDRGGAKCYALATALFILGGAFVEYLWMGVLCCLGAWLFCREDVYKRQVHGPRA